MTCAKAPTLATVAASAARRQAVGRREGFWSAAAIVATSELVVTLLMYETLPARRRTRRAWEREARFQ
ncbi:MAG TPA: hypothetical protein VF725_11750 [Ktedonobacterales bacterium]